MSEEKDLIKSVSRVARALWTRNIIEQTLCLGFYGAMLSIILILLVKFSSLLSWVATSFYLIPIALGILLGLFLGIVRKPRLNETALFLDRSLGLQNRLATLIEHLNASSSNPLVNPLLSDTIRYQTQFSPAVAYKRFNTNYLFQCLLAGLGIIIIWLIPGYPRPALADMAREQAEKLKATAQDICRSNRTAGKHGKLDDVTQTLVSEMEGMARAIEEGEINPEEISRRLNELSQKAKEQIRYCEAGQELFTRISFIMGEALSGDMTDLEPGRVKKTLDYLQDQINQGRISIDFLKQLKQAISQAKNAVQDDPALNQLLDEVLKTLETPVANLTPALQEFFDTLARKNRAVLERIRARLSMASKEISRGVRQPGYQVVKPLGSPRSFSRADGPLAPLHPTGSDSLSTFDEIPITSTADAERINLIKEVIKRREAALNKPYWPPEYDEIIRQYFLPAPSEPAREESLRDR